MKEFNSSLANSIIADSQHGNVDWRKSSADVFNLALPEVELSEEENAKWHDYFVDRVEKQEKHNQLVVHHTIIEMCKAIPKKMKKLFLKNSVENSEAFCAQLCVLDVKINDSDINMRSVEDDEQEDWGPMKFLVRIYSLTSYQCVDLELSSVRGDVNLQYRILPHSSAKGVEMAEFKPFFSFCQDDFEEFNIDGNQLQEIKNVLFGNHSSSRDMTVPLLMYSLYVSSFARELLGGGDSLFEKKVRQVEEQTLAEQKDWRQTSAETFNLALPPLEFSTEENAKWHEYYLDRTEKKKNHDEVLEDNLYSGFGSIWRKLSEKMKKLVQPFANSYQLQIVIREFEFKAPGYSSYNNSVTCYTRVRLYSLTSYQCIDLELEISGDNNSSTEVLQCKILPHATRKEEGKAESHFLYAIKSVERKIIGSQQVEKAYLKQVGNVLFGSHSEMVTDSQLMKLLLLASTAKAYSLKQKWLKAKFRDTFDLEKATSIIQSSQQVDWRQTSAEIYKLALPPLEELSEEENSKWHDYFVDRLQNQTKFNELLTNTDNLPKDFSEMELVDVWQHVTKELKSISAQACVNKYSCVLNSNEGELAINTSVRFYSLTSYQCIDLEFNLSKDSHEHSNVALKYRILPLAAVQEEATEYKVFFNIVKAVDNESKLFTIEKSQLKEFRNAILGNDSLSEMSHYQLLRSLFTSSMTGMLIGQIVPYNDQSWLEERLTALQEVDVATY